MSAENKGDFSTTARPPLQSPMNRPVNMMDRSKERGDFEADFRNFMIADQNKRTSDASGKIQPRQATSI